MYVETPDDYRLKFAHTVVKYGGNLVRLDDFEHGENYGDIMVGMSKVSPRQGFKVMDEGEPLLLNKNLMDWKYPKLGWINTHRQASFVTRNPGNPEAKYKKAFSYQGVKVFSVPNSKGNTLYDKEANVVWYIFNPEYFTIEKSLDLIRKGKRYSVAINNRYAIVADFIFNKIKVRRDTKTIGIINTNNKLVIPYNTTFLMEELSLNGFEVEVC